jgi:D-sedoheptulose 7-phosphate isomerase
MNFENLFKESALDFHDNFMNILKLDKQINKSIYLILNSLKKKKKIMFCGNGGSAAQSNHLSAELIGRYLKKRHSIPSISLASDQSNLTAIANDFDFSQIFSRQIEGIGKKGDVLFALSTSGKSSNIIKAIACAKKKNIKVIFLTSTILKKKIKVDCLIKVPSNRVDRIQELHLFIGHFICKNIEDNY